MSNVEYKGSEFNTEEVLNALSEFFYKSSNMENRRILCDLLFLERKIDHYPESCSLIIEKGYIMYNLYDKKEYYHDGSVQDRKSIEIKIISSEEYESLKRETKKAEKIVYIDSSWLKHFDELYLLPPSYRCCEELIGTNFLSCNYIHIKIRTML